MAGSYSTRRRREQETQNGDNTNMAEDTTNDNVVTDETDYSEIPGDPNADMMAGGDPDEDNHRHEIGRGGSTSTFDPNDWNLEEGVEPFAVRDNTEARLRIMEVVRDTDKNGFEYLLIRLEIPEEPYSKDFTHFLGIPDRRMDAKKLNRVRFAMRTFLQSIGFDASSRFDPTVDLNGLECWAILGFRNTTEYGDQNFVKKFL